MAEENNRSQNQQRGTFVERLVRKTLSSVGGVFERPFQPSSDEEKLPATSDLTERLKRLIDAGVREQKDGSRVAPHLIRLKYTWGETTDEFEANLKRLKNELLVVAIDHINDNRYRTIAPVKLEIKPDILSEGFTLAVGFDASDIANAEKVEIPTEIFAGSLPQATEHEPQKPLEIEVNLTANFPDENEKELKLHFIPDGKTNLTIGRSKENDIFLDDKSVSKLHASLVMSTEGKLRVADVGSTNGTYVDKERISYGKAYEIKPSETIVFGEVKCCFEWNLSSFEKPDVQTATAENASPNVVAANFDEAENVEHNVDGEAETTEKSSGAPETIYVYDGKKSE